MVLETYRITVKHDNGKARFIVVSLHGEKGAEEQVMAVEGCPESAIVKIRKINSKTVR